MVEPNLSCLSAYWLMSDGSIIPEEIEIIIETRHDRQYLIFKHFVGILRKRLSSVWSASVMIGVSGIQKGRAYTIYDFSYLNLGPESCNNCKAYRTNDPF